MVLLVPVKALGQAKSRLRGAHTDHDGLVLALVHDTLAAAAAAGGVVQMIVVSADRRAGRLARRFGADVCSPATGDLNADLRVVGAMVRRRHAEATIAVLPADLPSLRTRELESALETARGRRAFVPDREGSGTTLLLSGRSAPLDPRYGRGSGDRHAATGALRLAGPWPSLTHDVDTSADLALAATLGLGRRTGRLMREHETRPSPQPMRASARHDDARSA